MNLQENIHRIKEVMGINEGLHDTSWQNEEGDKVTLIDLLSAIEELPEIDFPVSFLKDHVLDWNNDPEEMKKVEKSDLQYPILILVNNNGKIISIIDGHHRAQKAIRKGLDFIKAKIITKDQLPKNIQKVFYHLKEMTGIEKQPINEYFFSGLLDKITDLFGSGLDSERQQRRAVESFQKLVDFMTKITMKDSPVKGLERMVVKEIGKQNWGSNFNNPNDKGTHVEFKVKIEPLFNDPKNFQSADEFHEFNNFVHAFFQNAKRMGLTHSSPLDEKDVITSRVTYTVQSEPHKYHRVS